MTNSEIKIAMMSRFGFDDTIKFCEMVSFMFHIKHKSISESVYDEYDYGYDAKWWKEEADKLKELYKQNSL